MDSKIKPRVIVVVGARPTVIDTFGDILKDMPLSTLATTALEAMLERSGVPPADIGSVIPTKSRDAYLGRGGGGSVQY